MTVEDKQEIRDSQQCLTSKRPQVLRSVLVFGSECSMPFRVLLSSVCGSAKKEPQKKQALVKGPFTHAETTPCRSRLATPPATREGGVCSPSIVTAALLEHAHLCNFFTRRLLCSPGKMHFYAFLSQCTVTICTKH